jgi:hypothetical protein
MGLRILSVVPRVPRGGLLVDLRALTKREDHLLEEALRRLRGHV